MKVELTSAQANMLRYAAEYKLEQEEDGDGIPDRRDRRVMEAAVEALYKAFKWERRPTGVAPAGDAAKDTDPCECEHERGDHDVDGCHETVSTGLRCSCPSFKPARGAAG